MLKREIKLYCIVVSHCVIIPGQIIVLPESLHKKVICTAHEGHQGLVKTKQLLQS